MVDPNVAFTFFESYNQPEGESSGEITWATLVDVLTTPIFTSDTPSSSLTKAEKFQLPLFSLSLFDGRRANENFIGAWAIGFDCDAYPHVPEEEVRKALEGLDAFAYTSPMSTKDKLRWRVGVRLSGPVVTEEDFRATQAMLSQRIKALGPTGSSEPARQFFFPRADADLITLKFSGVPFNVVQGKPKEFVPTTDGRDMSWIFLKEEDIEKAVAIIEPHFIEDHRDNISYYLAGACAWLNIKQSSAYRLLVRLGDDPSKRMRQCMRAYEARANDTSLPGLPKLAEEIGGEATAAFEALIMTKMKVPKKKIDEKAKAVVEAPHEYTFDLADFVINTELQPTSMPAITRALTSLKEWEGVWRYNEFSHRIEAYRPPVKLDAEGSKGLSKVDITKVQCWLAFHHEVNAREDHVKQAIAAAANIKSYHPVHEYFKSLPPGDPRFLNGLAMRLFGAIDPLEEVFLRKFLVQCVNRVMRPGCQADSALTLYEPKGGLKKSTFVRELFGEAWSAVMGKVKMGDIESSRKLAGKMAFEIAEMAAMKEAQIEDVKAYMTTTTDYLRDMHHDVYYDRPRQCCFVCTTNNKEILHDEAHERRFFIIEVRKKIDTDFVRQYRDQIWAAAYALYLEGHQYWLTDEEKEEASLLLKEFREGDSWEETIRSWIGRSKKTSFTVGEVWAGAFDGEAKECDKAKEMRLAKALKAIGCKPVREGAARIRKWTSVPS